MSTLSKLHPSLPSAVMHSGHSASSQSKSHVLAGVQDAYWTDDEAEDAECPLCLEEMDISDLNFKPCPCSYQICRFCWHHIKENLNGRCPACRREYTDDAVQFKPVNKEDHKRLTQQKKQRERERKDLDALGRRHYLNVRVVQRNVVYVVGLGARFAKEELIPTLRSNDYFGQYGKITKILLVKRTPPGGRTPILGLYITYYRREDAARTIAAVDGSSSPSGGGEVMRASYGTTKYCISFLRGLSCTINGCMDLHEWGDEKDCFTKEDLTTLKHTMKDTENRQRNSTTTGKKTDENVGLPRTAGWGQKPALGASSVSNSAPPTTIPVRSARRGHRSTRSGTTGETRVSSSATSGRQVSQQDRKVSTKTPSQASNSRPPTPAASSLPPRPSTPSSKATKPRRESQNPLPPRSPTSSVAVESDIGSLEAVSASPALSASRVSTPPVSTPVAPPGLPAVPPGLVMTPPPGISTPASAQSSSPLVREASATAYQISTQAQALLDDVRNRRESLVPSASFSPFPDLDRTLQNLSGGDGETGGFNFNLDPKLAVDDDAFDASLPDLDEATELSPGTFFDPFSSNRPHNTVSPFGPPPGLSHTNGPSSMLYESFKTSGIERTSSAASSYTGSFNPFGETSSETASQSSFQRPSPVLDDDPSRRMSRFGFARERQGSMGLMNSASPSPLLSANTSLSSLSLADNTNVSSAASSHAPWPFQRQHEFPSAPPGLGPTRTGTPGSARGSPLVPYAHAQTIPPIQQASYPSQPSRFQPFDMNPSEVSLKDMLGIGRDRIHESRNAASDNHTHPVPGAPFQDPAIMSSVPYMPSPNNGGFHFSPAENSPSENVLSAQLLSNRPPGLSYQNSQHLGSQGTIPGQLGSSMMMGNGPVHSPMMQNQVHAQGPLAPSTPSLNSAVPIAPESAVEEPSVEPSVVLSAADFPALPTASVSSESQPQSRADETSVADEQIKAKLGRKAAKKVAQAERAAERERIAKERAAERLRIAKEKAEEKERIEKDKLEEKERMQKQKTERERVAREKAERDAEKERAEKEKQAVMKKIEADKAAAKAAKAKEQAALKQTQKAAAVAAKAEAKAAAKTQSVSSTDANSPMPMLSKMPKKNRPVTKPIKIPREDDSVHDAQSSIPSAVTTNSETAQLPGTRTPNVTEVVNSSESEFSNSNGTQSIHDRIPRTEPKSITQLLQEISIEKGQYYLDNHPFFDPSKINPAAKMALDYGTMKRALSAFPAGGGSFVDNASTRLDDKTVSSFQQLLETLTQTMSELIQLLPQATWGSIFDVLSQDLKELKREYSLRSSTSFDGLVHDDLPDDADEDEDDFLEDLDGDVPTSAMDKRAKWMEVQLAKLEELHRDVNTAAARAILATNDRGWDIRGCLPHIGNTLARFEHLGHIDEGGKTRRMTPEEVEKKLIVGKEAAVFAETELREAMQSVIAQKP